MTTWKLLGFAGTGLFAARWAIQYLASRRARRSVVPRAFWLVSLAGSATLLVYFSLGPNRDAVGVLGNLFPAAVAGYNLLLLGRERKDLQDKNIG
jgi:lipid-A-disaccharide synthase-like uncharacterized protein